MRSSAALATVFSASRVLFTIISNSEVATAVNSAYGNASTSDNFDRSKPYLLGRECSFVVSSNLRNGADTGVLGCETDYICVEDKKSSLGGSCISISKLHRGMKDTPACDTKCTGEDACGGGTDPNIVGDRSCCGYRACYGITGMQQFE